MRVAAYVRVSTSRQVRLETIELSAEGVTEEVAVAVPLSAVIERNEEEVRLLECPQPAC